MQPRPEIDPATFSMRGNHLAYAATQGIIISSQITFTSNTHALAHIPGTRTLISSNYAVFNSLPQPHHATAFHPSIGDNLPVVRGRSEKTEGQTEMATLNSIIYICSRTLQSLLSFAYCRAASFVILNRRPLWFGGIEFSQRLTLCVS